MAQPKGRPMSTEDMQAIGQLPQEVQDAILAPNQIRQATIDSLNIKISKLRDEAIKYRKESGIEDTWTECEEAYLGIDDENRNEFAGARWVKPLTTEGPLTRRTNSSDEVRATAFVKLTSRYVDAGAAKVCEIALPVDSKAFSLRATPIPEVTQSLKDQTPAQNVTGRPMPGKDGQPVTVADLAKHMQQQAEDAAEKAANRIYDWMVEYKHPAVMRRVVHDMARLGCGIVCGPVPEMSQARSLTSKSDGSVVVEMVQEVKPVAKWVDPWTFYPAAGCGEDIHRGDHCFESDQMLANEVRALKENADEGQYIESAIDQVLMEGPGKINVEQGGAQPQRQIDKHVFQVWTFRGSIDRSEFEAANPGQAAEQRQADEDTKTDRVFVVITLINDTVVRAVQSPMDSGKLPYHVIWWTRRAGFWAGVGVAEQIRTPQRILNSATRRMLSNAGLSSGAQVITVAGSVTPADGDMRITPDKLWNLDPNSGIDDVRKAFSAFEWPNATQQLMQLVEYAFKLAEEQSSIPLITQGQSGKTTPDTFGGQQLQDNNANQLLRAIGFNLNDQGTAPLVDGFYEWLLLDPDVPADEKGDFHVDVSGALALIEKALQDQFIVAMGQLVANPAFKIDPSRWFSAYCRAKHMNPEDFQYTDVEWEQISKTQAPPIPVQVAQVKAQSAQQIQQAEAQAELQQAQAEQQHEQQLLQTGGTTPHMAMASARVSEAQIRAASAREVEASRAASELAYAQTEAQIARDNNASMQQQAADKRELLILEYSLKNNLTLEQVKAQLAQTAMQEQTKRQLAGVDTALKASEIERNHSIEQQRLAANTSPLNGVPA